MSHLSKGQQHFDSQNYEAAVGSFSQALTEDPKDKGAFNYKGMALFMLGKHPQAIQNYNKALELDPEFANAYHNRGWAQYLLNEKDLALADINKAIEKINAAHQKRLEKLEQELAQKVDTSQKHIVEIEGPDPFFGSGFTKDALFFFPECGLPQSAVFRLDGDQPPLRHLRYVPLFEVSRTLHWHHFKTAFRQQKFPLVPLSENHGTILDREGRYVFFRATGYAIGKHDVYGNVRISFSLEDEMGCHLR